jgi:hypothetical protein
MQLFLRNVLPASLRQLERTSLKADVVRMPLHEPEYLNTDPPSLFDANISPLLLNFIVLGSLLAPPVSVLLSVITRICGWFGIGKADVNDDMQSSSSDTDSEYDTSARTGISRSTTSLDSSDGEYISGADLDDTEAHQDADVIWQDVPSPPSELGDLADEEYNDSLSQPSPLAPGPVRVPSSIRLSSATPDAAAGWDVFEGVRDWYSSLFSPTPNTHPASRSTSAEPQLLNQFHTTTPSLVIDTSGGSSVDGNSSLGSVDSAGRDKLQDHHLRMRFNASDGTTCTIVGYRLVKTILVDLLSEQGGTFFLFLNFNEFFCL